MHRLFAIVLTAALISGCNNFRIYSETRNKQAENLNQAWAAVDTKALITTERNNLTALHNEELKTQERAALAKRNQIIRAIATDAPLDATLLNPIKTGIDNYAGSRDQLNNWKNALESRDEFIDEQIRNEMIFQQYGFELPSCNDLTTDKQLEKFKEWITNNAVRGEIIKSSYDSAKTNCTSHPNTEFSSIDIQGSLLSERGKLLDAEKKLDDIKNKSLEARNGYRLASAEYEAAVAIQNKNPKVKERIEKAKSDLNIYYEIIKSVNDSASDIFSEDFLTDERRETLDAFFAEAAKPDQPTDSTPKSSRLIMASKLIPELIDNSNKTFSDAKSASLAPFILRKNLEQLKHEAITRDIATRTAEIRTRQEKLNLMSETAFQLETAEELLSPVKEAHPALGKMSLPALLSIASPDHKKRIYHALSLYLDTIGRMNAEENKLTLRLSALDHERALAYSEVNILQWNTLINSSASQLEAYAASGIKPEKINSLINSLVLIWIGAGVN